MHRNIPVAKGNIGIYNVRELYCTWLLPCTRASSDGVDVSDLGEWIHLKRGVDRGGCGPIGVRGHRIILCGRAKYQELKANAKRLHIETGLPIPTNDLQLLPQSASGGSSSSSLVHLLSSVVADNACIERGRRLWGYIRQAQDKFASFMTSFAF
ncbi:hypothetical protein M9H77_11723 [Catharanthus roseus]|uniref:Uncharacterized protein n=1 Tax=Catharanthus roseus TaxID=4058 RepID=A0ACC0BFB0_CATRO|nr:hypothetical protein M9H77_11723 [Catharanthus roseus]